MRQKINCMKFCKLLFVSFFIVFSAVPSFSQDVNYGYQYGSLTQIQMYVYKITNDCEDSENTGNAHSRSPMQAPTIGFDGRRLYLYGQFSGLTLQLLDNGVIVYSASVEAYANEVVLPDMPGTYELQLCDDRYIYSCELKIEY